MIFVLSTISAGILGFLIFISHSYFLNHYLKTKNNLALSLMLPMITAIITKAISTNLFLSLGMIGALSIIRYRTPVKSTYELALLFALVTVGISSIVNIKYSIFLSVLIIGISILVFFLSKLNFLKNVNFENSTNNTEIVFQTNEKFNLEKLDSYKNKLVSSQYNFKDENKKTFVYKFDKTDEAQEFHKIISNEEHVQSINLQNYLN
tara:strand:+ start:1159 stop:1779 length:621 start_codon:yes stop_codon:yes gene_type:complete